MDLNNFAYNLRMLRTEKKITARQLSLDLYHVDYRISEIEKRSRIRITPQEINRIAQYFDVSIEDLLNKKAHIIFK